MDAKLHEYEGWIADLDKNLLFGPGGYEQRFAPTHIEILYTLLGKKGGVVYHDVMIGKLWGHLASERAPITMRVQIGKLKTLLPPQLVIRTAWGNGYWIEVKNERHSTGSV